MQGNDDLFTILHELGHALGLKHGHDNETFGRIPKAFDSYEFSVMTYRSFVGANPRDGSTIEEFGSPQSFMMLDIAALQHLYGADFEVNSGDTVYSWKPRSGKTFVDGEVALDPVANIIFATIWDGGGHDTYDLSRYRTDLEIDLRPGKHSEFSDWQTSWLGGGPNGGFARGNIFNALQYGDDPRSLIEKALAGRGDDLVRGNDADNRLLGLKGDDNLKGGRGADTLIGGIGADRLMGGRGDDIFVFRDASHSVPGRDDRLIAGGGAAAFAGAGERGGDVIDLRGIDADLTRPGKQGFELGAKTGPGALWLRDTRGDTVVLGNLDDDRRPEFRLVIEDGTTRAAAYAEDDFLL